MCLRTFHNPKGHRREENDLELCQTVIKHTLAHQSWELNSIVQMSVLPDKKVWCQTIQQLAVVNTVEEAG